MSQNGSPDPTFDFDPDRTYFRVILPAHPSYALVHALRESSYLWSVGERQRATGNLRSIYSEQPHSGAIAGQLIEYLYDLGEKGEADQVFETFHRSTLKREAELPYLRYFKILLGNGEREAAKRVIESLAEAEYGNAPVEVAIAFKRLGIFDKAHTVLSGVYSTYDNDPYYLHNYAQVKIAIANNMWYSRNRQRAIATVRRLQKQAIELLRRAVSLSNDRVQLGWCWFDLARTLTWVRYPRSAIAEAYDNAMKHLPDEHRFVESYERWKERTS